jgi:hypothetical protein
MKNIYKMKCKAGEYKANSILGLAWEIFKHRFHHLIKHKKWMD